jgi:histidyl-tRNA synthetase
VGFAIGEDRLLDVLPAGSPARREAAQLAAGPVVVAMAQRPAEKGNELSASFRLAERLRRAGIPAVEATSHKVDKILERARTGGAAAVVFAAESGEVHSVKLLASGERRELAEADLVREFRKLSTLTSSFQDDGSSEA